MAFFRSMRALGVERMDSESRNHQLYQPLKLGDDDDVSIGLTSYPGDGMADPSSPLRRAYFTPRPLEILALADELELLDPIVDSKAPNILPFHPQ